MPQVGVDPRGPARVLVVRRGASDSAATSTPSAAAPKRPGGRDQRRSRPNSRVHDQRVHGGRGRHHVASRLRSVATNTGGGNLLLLVIAAAVIGGTSLFGGVGPGHVGALGALVIASIQNGIDLLGLASGTKFVITGLVLPRRCSSTRSPNAAAPPAASAEARSMSTPAVGLGGKLTSRSGARRTRSSCRRCAIHDCIWPP